ncbi:glutathione S-transferase family protein [Ostreiculturibacter nitratireducens]|uniref:glutathione S-transferase family protein n=1 Tax=Ostreiculturibacter nitratireducens TaxID=3075226 RepID=UPI0031B600A0
MITIYGVYRSRASRNFWLANELGIELRQVPVIQAYRLKDASAPDAPMNTLSPEFLKITATGAIPAMEDDGFVLTESLAINMYIVKKHGGPLAPKDDREEAAMLQWALYGATSVEAPALAILYAHVEGRAATPEGEAEVAREAEKLRRPLKVIDAHLATEGHMIGGRFTVADINMAEIVRYAQAHATLIGEFPALEKWLKACQSRPAFQAMWEKRMAEPA